MPTRGPVCCGWELVQAQPAPNKYIRQEVVHYLLFVPHSIEVKYPCIVECQSITWLCSIDFKHIKEANTKNKKYLKENDYETRSL